FRDGDPPPDLALEYYRVLGATILGYQEARTKLGDYVARNPEDMDARLEYDRILTYRIASRAEGLADLKRMARDADSTHIRHRALASWREALPWEPVTGSSIPLYQEWLASHPDDVEIRKLMQKAQLTQASIDAATARMAGYKLLSEKKYAEAASQFQQALTLSPNDPDSLGGLGIAAQAQQHPDEARA
ncbi:tetratricopeptide repeat protein, partial [Novacetimonas hansenii]